MKKQRYRKIGRGNFWNKEYARPEHLALSTAPSEDLKKFTRWLERQSGAGVLNHETKVLDLGCGNGRHLIYLHNEYGCRGIGYDTSEEAIGRARVGSAADSPDLGRSASGNPKSELPATSPPSAALHFEVRSIAESLPLPDASVDLVLDMMSSHVLRQAERENWRQEIVRVLRPGGWFFLKTFLAEDDLNVKRLLRDYPAGETNSYLHPALGVYEHVWTVPEIEEFFAADFEIGRLEKSHKHFLRGRAFKRRFVVVYLRKRDFN